MSRPSGIAKTPPLAILAFCLGWLMGAQLVAQNVSLGVSSVLAAESAGEAVVEISRATSSAVPLTVKWATADGTAKAGEDYVATNGTVMIGAGQVGTTVKIALIHNGRLDGNRQFQLILSEPSPAADLPDPGVIAIRDAELNGSVDPDFHPATITPSRPWMGPFFVAQVPTGKPGDAGKFWFSDGLDDVARFDADGSRDPGFQLEDALLYPHPETLYHRLTPLLALQDGGLLVWERSYIVESESYYTNRLLRLQPDGRRDPGFADPLPDLGDSVPEDHPLLLAVEQAGQGIILVSQSDYAGANSGFARVSRIRPDGRLDTTFIEARVTCLAALPGRRIHTLLLDSRKRILLRGDFDHLNGAESPYVLRLNPDGRLDPTFKPNLLLDAASRSVAFADDMVLHGSDGILLLPNYPEGAAPSPPILRLKEDGTLDASFNTAGLPSVVYGLFTDYDGGVLFSGLRLTPAGQLDEGFQPLIGVELPGITPCPGCNYGDVMAIDALGRYLLASGARMINGTRVSGVTRLERNAANRRQFQAVYPSEFPFRSGAAPGFGESESFARIHIIRTGDTHGPASVEFATVDDSAKAGRDYVATSGSVEFGPLENELEVRIPLLDNAVSDGDRRFRIALRQPSAGHGVPAIHAPFNILDDETGFPPGSIRLLADGRTRLTLLNPPVDDPVMLQSSADLKNWLPVLENRGDFENRTLTFEDPNTPAGHRFYRAVPAP